METYDSVVDLIGNTPLVRLHKVTEGAGAPVYAKVEYFNPGGSVKDRIALRMVDAAEREGLLKPGGTIVEPTSGNTGVGLALVAQQRGYSCVFVVPDKVSQDKINVLKAYGAEVVVCPTAVPPEHPDSYYNVSDRLAREIPGAWKPDQYANQNNPMSHYEQTGPELWRQTDGRDHALRGRRRDRRHHHRHRPLPQGGLRRARADRRRRPGGLGLLRRHRAPVPRRGRRRGLLADDVRPVGRRRGDRGERRRLVRDDPAAGPRGGAARSVARAAWRWWLPSRSRSGSTPDDMVVVLLPDSGRGYLSKVFNDEWLAQYGFLPERRREPVGRRRPAHQGRRPADLRAHPPERDAGRGDRDPARVRRLADAGRPGRAAGDGR